MTDVAVRELLKDTRQVLERVEAGEHVVITVDGRPMAELRPISRRPRLMDRDRFIEAVLPYAADPAMSHDLAVLAPDTTDDVEA